MDVETLGVCIAIAKSLPDTAAQRAEAAQSASEAAAAEAKEYGQRITFENNIINIGVDSE